MEGIQPIARFRERPAHLVSQAVVQRQAGAQTILVLTVHGERPRRAVEVRIAGRLAEHGREAEQEVGGGAAGILAVERVVAVGIEDVRSLYPITAELAAELQR